MNELIFSFHILFLMSLSIIALKLGEKALSCFIVLMSIISNLFVLKQIELFSLTVTAADAYTICGLFSLNLLQEYFGKEKASKIVSINFFCMLSFGLLAIIHLKYIPSPIDLTQNAYHEILSLSPRLIVSSLASYFVSQKIDVLTFGYLREKIFPNSISKSSLISSLCSQTVDTILFSLLALYGEVNSVLSIIFLSLVIKFITILAMSPMMNYSKKIMVKA